MNRARICLIVVLAGWGIGAAPAGAQAVARQAAARPRPAPVVVERPLDENYVLQIRLEGEGEHAAQSVSLVVAGRKFEFMFQDPDLRFEGELEPMDDGTFWLRYSLRQDGPSAAEGEQRSFRTAGWESSVLLTPGHPVTVMETAAYSVGLTLGRVSE